MRERERETRRPGRSQPPCGPPRLAVSAAVAALVALLATLYLRHLGFPPEEVPAVAALAGLAAFAYAVAAIP